MILLSEFSGGGIKLVQRGTTAISGAGANETVTAVDMNKSFLTSSYTTGAVSGDVGAAATAKLTSSTNIAFSRSSSSNTTTVSWELVEFY